MNKKTHLSGNAGKDRATGIRNVKLQKSVSASTTTEIHSRYALLIGVRDYTRSTFSTLPHTVHDVIELEKVLKRFDYTVRTLHSDKDIEDKPTRENIWGELESISKLTEKGDLLLIYFGGHGTLDDNNDAYLLPSNYHEGSLNRTAINLNEFKEVLTSAGAQAKILILDACHAGIVGRRASGMDLEFERRVYLEAVGTATLAACRHGEVAYEYEDKYHGAFTYFILEGLQGAAKRNKSTILTFNELKNYVTDKVKKWAVEKGLHQWPNASTQLVGDPPLVVYQSIETGTELNKVSRKLFNENSGFKYFRNYSFKEYDHQPQNWDIIQAKNGVIYIANQGGVLEFDGVSWRVIYDIIPNYTVRSLAIDDAGIIYIGGENEMGYLTPDSKGFMKYVSILDNLNDKYKNFFNVWRTHITKEGIFFRTSKYLFRWNTKRIKVWERNRFKSSFKCKGNFYVQVEGIGLMQVKKNSLKLLRGGEIFSEDTICLMAPYDSDKNSQKLLIGTHLKGFYLYDGIEAKSFTTEVDEYLIKNRVFHGIRLSSGDFALATRDGGLVFMDSHGHLKYIFDKRTGLQDENVKYVFEDVWGNVWLGLNSGISMIEYKSPFFNYNDRSDLPGIVLSVVRHHDDLYAGTSDGLYILHSSSKSFQHVPGIISNCQSLLSIGQCILAATADGLFQIDYNNNMQRNILKDLSYVLLQSERYPSRIWCGTNVGLVALSKKEEQWEVEKRFETIKQEIRNIVEDKKGNIWLGTLPGRVLKVNFPDTIGEPVVKRYATSHGLPDGEVYIAIAAGHVIFASKEGIFRFVERKEVFIPDTTLGEQFAGGQEWKPVFRIAEDKGKNIWFTSKSRIYKATPVHVDPAMFYPRLLHRVPLTQVNNIYPDPNEKDIWFATADGLVRFDKTVENNSRRDFNVLIRKVIVNEKQVIDECLIFGGCECKKDKDSKDIFPEIEYKDRNLYFEFAAPFYEANGNTFYRFFLEGYDSDWSVWNIDTKRNYTNLDPGQYTFRVQALNIYEYPGVEAEFRFKVLQPA